MKLAFNGRVFTNTGAGKRHLSLGDCFYILGCNQPGKRESAESPGHCGPRTGLGGIAGSSSSGAVRRRAKCWAAVTTHRPPQEQLPKPEIAIAKRRDTIAIESEGNES